MAKTMTSEERRGQIAAILAAAIVRLRLRAALPGPDISPQGSSESVPNCLEVSRQTRLSVHGS
jgi:hypothetical protein